MKCRQLFVMSHRWCPITFFLIAVTSCFPEVVAENQAEPNVPLVPLRIPNQPERRDWIESWIFNGQTQTNARVQLENSAAQRLQVVKEKGGLDEDQFAKLELAAQGDIARFFRQIEQFRGEYHGLNPNRENMQEIAQRISPIQQNWNKGLAGPQSLFIRVLNQSLTTEQKLKLTGQRSLQNDERRLFHIRNFVKTIERTLPLKEDQRQKLIELIQQHSQDLNVDRVHRSMEQMVPYLVISMVSQNNAEAFNSILDVEQCKTLRQLEEHWRKNLPSIDQLLQVRVDTNSPEDWLESIR